MLRNRNRRALLTLAIALTGLVLEPRTTAQDRAGAEDANGSSPAAQDGGATPAPNGAAGGLTREQMWYAPTATDWAKPVLIEWQRTWEDARALSLATNRPILVCVNMDGEIASEHYAGIRYRQPEIAALYEPYVCVIASTYRHNPRDYDEAGNRIPCPRFGTVTCGEHIWIEPILYEKFLDGQRVAPRHIMVELDGSESYDVFYAFDTQSVFDTIERGITEREDAPPIVERGDRSLVERVGSPDSADRQLVESAYLSGPADLRQALLDATRNAGADASLDLLRLGIHDLDPKLAQAARERLAQAESADAIGLINLSLRAALDSDERRALIGALERLGEQSPQARLLAAVHRGLDETRTTIDVDAWRTAARSSRRTMSPEDLGALARAAEATDAEAQLELAEASLELAYDESRPREFRTLLAEDARAALERAVTAGATGWRVDAARALAAHRLGERELALESARAAVEKLPAGDTRWSASAVLAIHADALRRAIDRAVRRGEPFDEQWLADYHAASAVLIAHPGATEDIALAHYDFLWRLGAFAPAGQVLRAALARYPDSFAVHARFRGHVFEERGAAGLEPAYDRLVATDPSPVLEWYRAFARLTAAESFRRTRDTAAAIGAYERAEAGFSRAAQLEPARQGSSDHYAALALAGRARLALEAGELERSTELLVAALERAPGAAGSLDGLNLSPSDTSRTLRAALEAAERTDLVERLDAALATIDPALLELPAYERPQRPAPRRDRGERDR
ncbi:hypothetical protein Pla163_21870 [Planctomycetes bacterium Pla163]|uniref:Tetratricopeptide repeat protein n=1 Tax=Rohdeia mirabilis TaxID=2528008 RepID=A0A518D0Q6_9BACT|nr:hypothetical protein Pla163_21870 [Planctomycetes bacterium Pla163]